MPRQNMAPAGFVQPLLDSGWGAAVARVPPAAADNSRPPVPCLGYVSVLLQAAAQGFPLGALPGGSPQG